MRSFPYQKKPGNQGCDEKNSQGPASPHRQPRRHNHLRRFSGAKNSALRSLVVSTDGVSGYWVRCPDRDGVRHEIDLHPQTSPDADCRERASQATSPRHGRSMVARETANRWSQRVLGFTNGVGAPLMVGSAGRKPPPNPLASLQGKSKKAKGKSEEKKARRLPFCLFPFAFCLGAKRLTSHRP